MNAEAIYKEIIKDEEIVVQSFVNGFHSKRNRLNKIIHNHRKIAISELVFDIDCHMEELSKDIEQFISNNLIKDNISHSVWHTSRSYHIHMFFTDFKNYDEETRKALKRFMLKYYSKHFQVWLDYGVCSNRRMIRDFNGMHEVTGKPKKLVFCYGEDKPILNPIPSHILNDFMQGYKTTTTSTKALNLGSVGVVDYRPDGTLIKLRDFLNYACNTKFNKSGMQKNNLYFKNIAIAVYLLNLSKEETQQIFKMVAGNCKPHSPDLMENWIKWCKNQKHQLKVNWKEVKIFYSKQN